MIHSVKKAVCTTNKLFTVNRVQYIYDVLFYLRRINIDLFD